LRGCVTNVATASNTSRASNASVTSCALEHDVVPALASTAVNAGRKRVRCWSAGCASGEERYTVALVCNEAIASRFPTVRMQILATDVEPVVLERAGRAAYSGSSLKHRPQR
jgi:chemotaxis methyl-accepting protein methylase